MDNEIRNVFMQYKEDKEVFKKIDDILTTTGTLLIIFGVIPFVGVFASSLPSYIKAITSFIVFFVVVFGAILELDGEMIFGAKGNKLLKWIARKFYESEVHTTNSAKLTYGKYRVITNYSVRKELETNYVTQTGELVEGDVSYFIKINNLEFEISEEQYNSFKLARFQKAVLIVETEKLENTTVFPYAKEMC